MKTLPIIKKPFQITEYPLSPMASDIAKRLDTKIREIRKIETSVIEIIRDAGLSALLDGSMNVKISINKLEGIIRALESDFAAADFKHAYNFLISGICTGCQSLRWASYIPDKIFSISPSRPIVTIKNFQKTSAFQQLREFFLSRWHVSNAPEKVEIGDIIFSAATFTGVMRSDLMKGFIRSSINNYFRYETHAWIEWIDDHGHTQRFFLDTITDSLLLRWRYENQETENTLEQLTLEDLYYELNKVINFKKLKARSLCSSIFIIRNCWNEILEPFLFRMITGKIPSTLLPHNTLKRVLSGCHQASSEIIFDENDLGAGPVDSKQVNINGAIPQGRYDKSEWKSKIRDAVSEGKGAAKNKEKANRLLEGLSKTYHQHSLPYLLIQWVRWTISTAKNKKPNTLSTARTYLHRIDKGLHETLRGDSPLIFKDKWQEVIDLMIENYSSNKIGVYQAALKSFSIYLEKEHGFNKISFPTGDSDPTIADANFITEEEYLRASKLLMDDEPKLIALILGYRGGLRASECFGLIPNEYLDAQNPTLYIKDNSIRDLKTKTSKRILQLGHLCTDLEICVIRVFFKKHNTGSAQNIGAFYTDTQDCISKAKKKFFYKIRKVLKTVTGDMSFRYHHLRHTLINNSILQCSSMYTNIGALSQKSIDLRFALTGFSGSQRDQIYAVARLAGHFTPETTLVNYFHMRDWLLYQHATNMLGSVPDTFWSGIYGKTISALRNSRMRSNYSATFMQDYFISKIVTLKNPKRINVLSKAAAPIMDDFSEWLPIQLIGWLKEFKISSQESAIENSLSLTNNVIADLEKRIDISSFNFKRLHKKKGSETSCAGVPINRTWPLPNLPVFDTERKQINNLGISLLNYGRNHPQKLSGWLKTYIEHRSPKKNSVRFNKPGNEIKDFVTILKDIIYETNKNTSEANEILSLAVYFSPDYQSTFSHAEQLSAWHTLGLDIEIKTHAKFTHLVKHDRYRYGSLYVGLMPPSCLSKPDKQWIRVASSALNVAAYYAYLTLAVPNGVEPYIICEKYLAPKSNGSALGALPLPIQRDPDSKALQ